MSTKTIKRPPSIPTKFTRKRRVRHWGNEYDVTPAVVRQHMGNGRLLLALQPLNTRPNYYLIRVDSTFFDDEDTDDFLDRIDEVKDMIADEYGDKESERELLADDLRAQGIEPDASNTDLAGNEDRLGWPVLSLDSGCGWWEVARLK